MWIKCSKRKPLWAQVVLVTDGRQVGLGFIGGLWSSNGGWIRPVALDPLYNITHWKPLPKVPLIYRLREKYNRLRWLIYKLIGK